VRSASYGSVPSIVEKIRCCKLLGVGPRCKHQIGDSEPIDASFPLVASQIDDHLTQAE